MSIKYVGMTMCIGFRQNIKRFPLGSRVSCVGRCIFKKLLHWTLFTVYIDTI